MACRRPTSTRRPRSSPSARSNSSTRPSRTSMPSDIVRKATASAASAPAARAALTSRSARSVSGVRSSSEAAGASIDWLSHGRGCDAVQPPNQDNLGQRRQHLVNHGLQRGVNHPSRRPRRYVRLTQNIKRIRTRFCHVWHATRHKSRARESLRRQMRSGGCAGSGRALRLDPFGLPVRFSASDAAADGRVRDVELHRERVVAAAFAARHAHGAQHAGSRPFDGISLRLVPGEGGAE